MKKTIAIIAAILALIPIAVAGIPKDKGGKKPVIKFEKTTINIGTFPADDAVKVCHFKFTNTGNADLYIHQAFASCGCTVPKIPTDAVKPGESDTITVTYDGTRKSPGPMRKSITIHNNSDEEMIKIYITGKMLPAKEKKVEVIEIEE